MLWYRTARLGTNSQGGSTWASQSRLAYRKQAEDMETRSFDAHGREAIRNRKVIQQVARDLQAHHEKLVATCRQRFDT